MNKKWTLWGCVNFEPTSLIIASSAFSALGSIQEGRSQASSYKRQAAVDEENARISRINAQRTAQSYSLQEDRLRRSQNLALGQQRAAAFESGVGGATGSNLDIQIEDAAQAELDALNLRYEGQNQRIDALNQATNFSNSAAANRANAKAARQAGMQGAIGAGITGAQNYGAYKTSLAKAATPKVTSTGALPWQEGVRSGRLARNPVIKKYDWE